MHSAIIGLMRKLCMAALLAAVSVLASAQNPYFGFVATPRLPIYVTPIITDPSTPEHTEFWDRAIGTEAAAVNGWSDGDAGFNGPNNSVFAAWLSIYSTTSVSQPDPGGETISKRSEATMTWEARWDLTVTLSTSRWWQVISPNFDSRLNMQRVGDTWSAMDAGNLLLRVWYIRQDSLSVGLSAYACAPDGSPLSGASGNASCINSLGHSISASNDWYKNTGWKPSKSDAGYDPFNFDKLPSNDSHVKFQDVILYYTGTDDNGNRKYASRSPLVIVSDQMDATSAAWAAAPPSGGGGVGSTGAGGTSGGTGGSGGLRSLAPRNPFERLYCSMAPPQVQVRVRVATSTVYTKEWARVFAEAGIAYNVKSGKGKFAYSDGQRLVPGTTFTVTDASGNVVYQNDAPEVSGQDLTLPVLDSATSGTYTVTVSAPGYNSASASVILSGTEPVDFGTLTMTPIIPPHSQRLALKTHRRAR